MNANRKHSNSITSDDNISPQTSSPINETNKLIKCFQLTVILPKHRNALMNIQNFINITKLSKMSIVKIHYITDDKWVFMVPENNETMVFCSDLMSNKFSTGVLQGLSYEFGFPCDKYNEEYSEMYNNAFFINLLY